MRADVVGCPLCTRCCARFAAAEGPAIRTPGGRRAFTRGDDARSYGRDDVHRVAAGG